MILGFKERIGNNFFRSEIKVSRKLLKFNFVDEMKKNQHILANSTIESTGYFDSSYNFIIKFYPKFNSQINSPSNQKESLQHSIIKGVKKGKSSLNNVLIMTLIRLFN